MIARLLTLLATMSVALAAASCAECESLLDCPNGTLCSQAGTCVTDERPPPAVPCAESEYVVDIIVTAPDETTQVGGEVSVDGGEFVEVAATGSLSMTLAPGVHSFSARRGEFTGNVSAEICRSATVAVPLLPPAGSVAVVLGVFDTIDRVLEKMGFVRNVDFDVIEQAALSAPGGLDQYRYLFINCGHSLDLSGAVGEQMAAWVDSGGALYTSDQAFNVVASVWPEQGSGSNVGTAGIYQAEVLDAALAEHLGKTSVELDYNLSAWHHVDSIGGNTVTLVRGTSGEVTGMPLLLQFERGEGRVTYTTFHNEAQTTSDMDSILSYLVFSL